MIASFVLATLLGALSGGLTYAGTGMLDLSALVGVVVFILALLGFAAIIDIDL